MRFPTFFKSFPPPRFLDVPHTGLDISDDAVQAIKIEHKLARPIIVDYASLKLPPGLLNEGTTTDEKKLVDLLSAFAKKNDITYVKVSVPEEKAYLFQTDVPNVDMQSIYQNIESKLEENVPLSAPDALFYFDLLPRATTSENMRASVSVVPRSYVERIIRILSDSGMSPLAFEVVPKSLARVTVPRDSTETIMVVHLFDHKVGIYIVSSGVVGFTSTVNVEKSAKAISEEIIRIHDYWISKLDTAAINKAILIGSGADLYEQEIGANLQAISLPVTTPNIWANISDSSVHVPPISPDKLLSYAVAAGLALPS